MYSEVTWYLPSHLPSYEFHFHGFYSVNLLVVTNDGTVWPGDYTEGKWFVLGVEIDVTNIRAWCYYPQYNGE